MPRMLACHAHDLSRMQGTSLEGDKMLKLYVAALAGCTLVCTTVLNLFVLKSTGYPARAQLCHHFIVSSARDCVG
jgi:hypothetical protein